MPMITFQKCKKIRFGLSNTAVEEIELSDDSFLTEKTVSDNCLGHYTSSKRSYLLVQIIIQLIYDRVNSILFYS